MNLTNKQIQRILDGAPLTLGGFVNGFNCNNDSFFEIGQGHNLADLEEILELRQEVERLKANLASKTEIGNQLKDELTKAFTEQSEVAKRAVEWGFLQGFNGALPLEEGAVKSLFENAHDAIDRFELKKRQVAKQCAYQYANQLREQGDEF